MPDATVRASAFLLNLWHTILKKKPRRRKKQLKTKQWNFALPISCVTKSAIRRGDSMIRLANERSIQSYLTKSIDETKKRGLYEYLLRDKYVIYHSINVARYGIQIGIACQCYPEELNLLATGGICHDIGKIKINPDVLHKNEKLSKAEFQEIMHHTEYGYHILQKAYMSKEVCEIARDHHERLDGSGYTGFLRPGKLTQIITVADIFSALTENREYHKACSIDDAIKIILNEKGIRREYLDLLINNLAEDSGSRSKGERFLFA